MNTVNPQRIATFASLQIGDTLMATSLYRALRIQYPNAELTLLSQASEHPVLRGFNNFDRVVAYNSDLDLDELYDLVVLPGFCGDKQVTANFGRFQKLISLARLHEKQRGSWRNKLDGKFTHLLFYKHQVELNAELAEAAGYTGTMPPLYCPQGDPNLYSHLQGRTGLFITTPQNEFQALPNRQWPLAYWKDLIRILSPSNVVLVGAESDLPNLERLAAETRTLYEAASTLANFTALCRNLKALVTTDGGGMHVAATTGVPIVSLHGTSSPILLHPWIYPDGKCISILAPNTCSPCQRSYRLRLCEQGTTQMECMPRLEPATVADAIEKLESLERGCLIMKGKDLFSKEQYLKSMRRLLFSTMNINLARLILRVQRPVDPKGAVYASSRVA